MKRSESTARKQARTRGCHGGADAGERQRRQIKVDGPFCWQAKVVLKTIAEVFGETNDIASARTVYVALSEIASNEGCETFTRSIAEIASRAGVSYSTAARLLKRFESLGLIAVERHVVEGTKERTPSTFLMLCNSCMRFGNHYRRFGNGRFRARSPTDSNKRKKRKKKKMIRRGPACGTSTPAPRKRSPSAASSSSFVSGNQYQHHKPVQNHVKWPEFAAWCRRKGGTPTKPGFWTWLAQQKPHWRDQVKKDFDEEGYELDGEFLTSEEANRRGMADPELLTRFRPAVRRDGKIILAASAA